MKHISTIVCLSGLWLVACTKATVTTEEPVGRTETALSKARLSKDPQSLVFTQTNLFPEGIAYDKFNDRFYVSSTARGDIGIVTADGGYAPFITDPDLVGTNGLSVDEARKRLWVTNAPDGSVAVYDSNNGNRLYFIDLKPLLPGAPVFINDLALDPQGNAYVTNSQTPVIYKITPDGEASIFYQDQRFATSGFGFNGIVYANSGFLLVAYSAGNTIVRFPLDNPASYTTVELNAPLAGPDGLLLHQNGKELVVVNNAGGANGYVSVFATKDKWTSGQATYRYETGPVFPTTATTDGKNVYVLYAYLNRRQVGQNDYTIQLLPGTGNF